VNRTSIFLSLSPNNLQDDTDLVTDKPEHLRIPDALNQSQRAHLSRDNQGKTFPQCPNIYISIQVTSIQQRQNLCMSVFCFVELADFVRV